MGGHNYHLRKKSRSSTVDDSSSSSSSCASHITVKVMEPSVDNERSQSRPAGPDDHQAQAESGTNREPRTLSYPTPPHERQPDSPPLYHKATNPHRDCIAQYESLSVKMDHIKDSLEALTFKGQAKNRSIEALKITNLTSLRAIEALQLTVEERTDSLSQKMEDIEKATEALRAAYRALHLTVQERHDSLSQRKRERSK